MSIKITEKKIFFQTNPIDEHPRKKKKTKQNTKVTEMQS